MQWICHLKRKADSIVANEKIWTLKQKLELQKICICHYDMLPSIQRVF